MKIYDENKNYVGEIHKPELIEQDGKWWEFCEYRIPKNEWHLCDGKIDPPSFYHSKETWIASEIPRATPEQLKAIGMREKWARPFVAKPGDIIWGENGMADCVLSSIGHYCFVLEPDTPGKVQGSCEDCDHNRTTAFCLSRNVCPNYTPKQPARLCRDCDFMQPDGICNCLLRCKNQSEWKPRQPPRPDCGEGYRRLDENEEIQDGDEYYSGDGHGWRFTRSGNEGKTPKSQGYIYRRKTQSPKPEEPIQSELKRKFGIDKIIFGTGKTNWNLLCSDCGKRLGDHFNDKCSLSQETKFSVEENLRWFSQYSSVASLGFIVERYTDPIYGIVTFTERSRNEGKV